jgi:purine-binding chemotaxis protein CheW
METALAPAPELFIPNVPSERQLPRLIFGTFFLAGAEFAIDMADIQEITVPPKKLQTMPLAPEFLSGLFNLRGRILPVVHLRLLLQVPAIAPAAEDIPCMVVLRRGPACVGILFDNVGEILRLAPNEIIPVTHNNLSSDSKPSPIKSILTQEDGERVIQILDLESLLAVRNLPALERRSAQRTDDENFATRRMKDLRRDKLIGFTVADCALALDMKVVLAIRTNEDKRPSPRKSSLCESVVVMGQRMIPVVPLAKLLNLCPTEAPERIIVCKIGETQVGFEVNQVASIVPYSTAKVLPIPILDDYRSTVIKGSYTDHCGDQFLVLNEQGTLSGPEIVELSSGHHQLSNERNEAEAKAIGPQVSLLTFRMGKLYGIKLLDVVEVLSAPKRLVRTPSMPSAVLGVLHLRGTPISVLDPRQLLHLDPARADEAASILVFLHQGRKIAMRVDSIESILSVPTGEEMQLPEIFFRAEQPKLMETFERGVHVETDGVKNVVIVLSANQIVKLLVNAMNES